MIKLVANVMFRPVDTFYALKFEGKGKAGHAPLLLLLAFAASLVGVAVTAFPYQPGERELSSLGVQAVRIFVPWLVWVIANYAVSTIMFGTGRFRDVSVGCAYALAPFIVLVVPIALLTNLLTLGERNLIDGLWWLVYGWIGLLLFLQLQVQHGFEGGRSLLAAAVMLFAAAVIVFAAILAYALTDQVVRFGIQVFLELTVRQS